MVGFLRIVGGGAVVATAGVAVVASATANITAGDPNIQFSSAQGSSGGNSPKERPETENINLDNKPKANSSKLQNFINSLYKGQGNPNQIGNGTTMDSIRYELETGNPVEGKFHSQKGQEFINGITKLINSGSLDAHDEAIAKAIVSDLANALTGK